MEIPLLDLRTQYAAIREEIRAAVDGVFESQRFILGPQVAAFEEEVAQYCRAPHSVALASGTDALLLSLKALGVGPGDCVVTVPYTFFATAGAIVNCGARPVFVDIEPSGFNMNPEGLSRVLESDCSFNIASQKLLHKRTGCIVKAVMPVHLYGQCADMDAILEIAQRYALPVVEDSCQAIGAKYAGQYAGTMGDAGCFSFFPSKNMGGAGDGGLVLTGREDVAARIRLMRNHGAHTRYHHSLVGTNSRLDEIQAAVLRVKLRHLERWNDKRQCQAAAYSRAFEEAGLGGRLTPPVVLPGRQHIFHQYVIRAEGRDDLRSFLGERGIGTEVYYPVPLHEQECFAGLGYSPSDFPCAREAARQTLALPVFPELTEGQRAHVVASIAQFYRAKPRYGTGGEV
jgi:dTDP-4-amino-4,6-dideoxygalactose transaminase